MVLDWARDGTHSALAVFREARKIPAMRHAVKAAPRDWWANTVRQYGRRRPVVRTRRALVDVAWAGGIYNIPAWETIGYRLGAGFFHEHVFIGWVTRETGGEHAEIWLAHPGIVLGCAAREWGLSCVGCDVAEKADTYETWHLCRQCSRARRSDKTVAHTALRLFQKEISDKMKQEREASKEKKAFLVG